MYLAEIHGKLSRENENKEDILTSNVFSFFKYTDRGIFLYQLLCSELGLEITKNDAEEAELLFWPRYADHTEPDLVIIVGKYYLLFEAKYFSGFGEATPQIKAQLIREIEGGELEAKNLRATFVLIAITAHHSKNTVDFKGVPQEYQSQIKWINWQSIAYMLRRIQDEKPAISLETKLFAEDLYQLLLKKNLRNYEGIRLLINMPRLSEHDGEIFFVAATATFRGDFIGFLNALSIAGALKPFSEPIFFKSGRFLFRDLSRSDQRIQKHTDRLFFREGKNE
jgi:hypothetical protein